MACRCDPFGLVCFLFFYFFLGYIDYAFVLWVLPQERLSPVVFYPLVGVYQGLIFMISWSHLMCFFSNPGVVKIKRRVQQDPSMVRPGEIDYVWPAGNGPPGQQLTAEPARYHAEWTFCKTCHIFRPPKAYHCHICRSCILKMDHHCPWINNCVGEYNQKYFLQFTAYILIGSLYTVAGTVFSICYTTKTTPVRVINTALITLGASIFGIFAVAVLCDQLSNVFRDPGNLERRLIDSRVRNPLSRMARLRETFDYIPVILWVIPYPFRSKPVFLVQRSSLQHEHLYAL